MTEAVIFLAMFTIVSVASYTFGWWWRGKHEREHTTTYRRTSRSLTPEEQEAFDETFRHLGKAFESARGIFK